MQASDRDHYRHADCEGKRGVGEVSIPAPNCGYVDVHECLYAEKALVSVGQFSDRWVCRPPVVVVHLRCAGGLSVGARLDMPPVRGAFPCPREGISGATASSRSA